LQVESGLFDAVEAEQSFPRFRRAIQKSG
jgi:hypothetical protein